MRALKGIDTLLHALAGLNQGRAQPLTATIVGSGPDGDTLKQLAARLGIAATTAFPGALPANRAFELGHTLVVPSRKESFPYVVLEAAAAGKPMIATDVGGIPEIVDGTGIRLIPPGDADTLARAMIETVNDPITARVRAQRLKMAVADRFTVSRMTNAVLEFYTAPARFPEPRTASPSPATAKVATPQA